MNDSIIAKNLLEGKTCSNCNHKSYNVLSECWRTYNNETDRKNWDGKYWRPQKPEGSCEEWEVVNE